MCILYTFINSYYLYARSMCMIRVKFVAQMTQGEFSHEHINMHIHFKVSKNKKYFKIANLSWVLPYLLGLQPHFQTLDLE